MNDVHRLNVTARYADATVFNNMVHAVEVPPVNIADIAIQTRSMLESLQKTLEHCGSGLDQLLMATIYLTDMADYEKMNAVWDAMIPEGHAPARACVKVCELASPEYKVEIAVTAAVVAKNP